MINDIVAQQQIDRDIDAAWGDACSDAFDATLDHERLMSDPYYRGAWIAEALSALRQVKAENERLAFKFNADASEEF